MQKSNLIKLLSSLDERDFKLLGKFVASPYFNSNSKLISFYKILKRYYPEFDSIEISNQNFFRILYKGNDYVEGTMYYIVSEMERMVGNFISHEKINPLQLDLTLLNELIFSNLESLYNKKYKVTLKKLNKFNDTDNLYHLLLSRINLSHITRSKEIKTKKDLFRKEWYAPVEELIRFFLRSLLVSVETILNYTITINEKLDIPMLNEILQMLEKYNFMKKDFETKILYLRIKMLINHDIKIFNYLKTVVPSEKLDRSFINELITSLQLFCSRELVRGNNFVEEEFNIVMLYEKYNREALKKFTKIDFYYQTFMLALSLGKYDWLRKFHIKYSKLIDEKYQNNAVHYGNAQLHYIDKEYDKALKELSQIKNYSFVHYKPAVKILQLRIYYELGFYSESEDLINAFNQFLHHDKLIPRYIKKAYSDFLKILLKLNKAASSNEKKKVFEVKYIINKRKEFLIARKWLDSQVEILESELNGRKSQKTG